MDKESLNYMTKKVDEGKVLSKRIEQLEKIKEKLAAGEGGLYISVFTDGSTKEIGEGILSSYIFEKYKGCVLDGVNAELEELKKEFEAL